MLSKWDRWNPYSEKKFLELYVSFQQKKEDKDRLFIILKRSGLKTMCFQLCRRNTCCKLWNLWLWIEYFNDVVKAWKMTFGRIFYSIRHFYNISLRKHSSRAYGKDSKYAIKPFHIWFSYFSLPTFSLFQ